MISLFRHYVPVATLLQLALEGGVFFVAMLLAIAIQTQGGATEGSPLSAAFTFAGLMVCVNASLGLYRRESVPSLARFAPRLLVALLIGFPIAYLLFFALPNGAVYQDALGYTVFIVLISSLGLRRVIDAASSGEGLFTHRILVLGIGQEAQTVAHALHKRAGLSVVGFYPVSAGDRYRCARHVGRAGGTRFERRRSHRRGARAARRRHPAARIAELPHARCACHDLIGLS